MVSIYMSMMEGYLSKAYSLEEFAQFFFERFKNEQLPLSEDVYCVLDKLFGDLDALTDDESLLQSDPDYYLNAGQVHHCVECAYEALKMLRGRH